MVDQPLGILVRLWLEFYSMGRLWADYGPIMGRLWADYGPVMVRNFNK